MSRAVVSKAALRLRQARNRCPRRRPLRIFRALLNWGTVRAALRSGSRCAPDSVKGGEGHDHRQGRARHSDAQHRQVQLDDGDNTGRDGSTEGGQPPLPRKNQHGRKKSHRPGRKRSHRCTVEKRGTVSLDKTSNVVGEEWVEWSMLLRPYRLRRPPMSRSVWGPSSSPPSHSSSQVHLSGRRVFRRHSPPFKRSGIANQGGALTECAPPTPPHSIPGVLQSVADS